MKTFVCLFACVVAVSAMDSMDQFINHVNSKTNGKWVAGKNFDSMESVKGLLGALDEGRVRKNYREGSDIDVKVYEAPEEFDSRDEWSDCASIKNVWDQANCGSCWAVGAAGAMSDRLCIHKGVQTLVSAQELMTCCFYCGDGCNGGYLHAAWRYWSLEGLVSGGGYGAATCQPYSLPNCDHHVVGQYQPCDGETDTPKCEKTCTNDDYNVAFNDDKTYSKSAYDVRNDEAAIQEEIQTNGPVEVAFTVYEDFVTYKSGVYEHVSGSMLGGHAVRMIGWGVEDGTKYWLIANSWNEDWGDKGLFKIKRGVDECGIEGNVVGGIPT